MSRRPSEYCLSDQEVEDFLFDRLSGVTKEVVEEHLLACPKCLDRVEQEDEFVRRFRAAARAVEIEDLEKTLGGEEAKKEPPPGGSLMSWWKRVGAITLAAAGLAAILFLIRPAWQGAGTVEVALRSERGVPGGGRETGPVGRVLRLTLDLTALEALPNFGVELVDANGTALEKSILPPRADRLVWTVRGRSAGQYWVRVYSPDTHELLREYSLLLR